MPMRPEPLERLVQRVRDMRQERALDLTEGRWETELEGKTLVAEIHLLDEILGEMKGIGGPGSIYGESDL